MKWTANVGEWSELYVMFKLLADGKLYVADYQTNRRDDLWYDVLKIIRKEESLEYVRNMNVDIVRESTGKIISSIPIKDFIDYAMILFSQLKEHEGMASFELPDIAGFAQQIGCTSIKAKSSEKSDIVLVLHDTVAEINALYGFSIKSQLGSPSTLLNASAATNFTYRILGHRLSEDDILFFNAQKKFSRKFKYLQELGSTLKFYCVDNKIFEFNLNMISADFPQILGAILEYRYREGENDVYNLVNDIAKSGVVQTLDNRTYISSNMKEFLTNIALGMMPATMWDGKYRANGGYIIVKEDGDVVCYHVYNRNEFMDYMLLNTKLDTPSTSRHKFGYIYNDEHGDQYIKLNLQIRFKK